MIRLLRATIFSLVCLLSLAAGILPASAADYPNRPVRWLIGFAAGGPVDIVARIMSQWLSDHFGQQFVVENRAGSGGNIAAAAAINSPPDGYTLLFVAPNNAISTSLYKKLPFDFIRDTVPVASIMQLTNMLVVSNAFPPKTVQEFIDYCKANPGKISYASSGNGTSVHMSAELFKAMTKADMTHVPYRGSALAYPDLISNKVRMERADNQTGWYGGRGWNDERGQWVNIEQRKMQMDRRIEQGLRSGKLTNSEAARLRAEFNAIASVEARYRRNGLDRRERADLDRRFDQLAAQIRFERNDRDRYGYNRY